jgi:hypothetical protein
MAAPDSSPDTGSAHDHRHGGVKRHEIGAKGALPNALAQQQRELLAIENANPA